MVGQRRVRNILMKPMQFAAIAKRSAKTPPPLDGWGVQKVRVLPESKIMRLDGKDFLLDKFIKQTDAQGKVNIISETGLIQMKSLISEKMTLGMTTRDASLVVRLSVAMENLILSTNPALGERPYYGHPTWWRKNEYCRRVRLGDDESISTKTVGMK